MIKWVQKDFKEFCGDPGQENNTDTQWNTQLFFTYPKTDAILNKIANIFPSKCYKKCFGILSIRINKLIFNT